jgi:hypothetical protein
VYRVDATNQPVRLELVNSGEFSGLVFAAPNFICAAKLFYVDAEEIVLPQLIHAGDALGGSDLDLGGNRIRG